MRVACFASFWLVCVSRSLLPTRFHSTVDVASGRVSPSRAPVLCLSVCQPHLIVVDHFPLPILLFSFVLKRFQYFEKHAVLISSGWRTSARSVSRLTL